ncbi:transposase [Streptomyces sp. NPDC006656]|uniref:transposase n=1 Tax=Streptomyces sp. NPDC006656 TaxID=3156899 RepID=UPI003456D239
MVIRRHELSDAEWELVQPLLPRPVLGRPRLDDRTVLNGIVWKFRTRIAGRDATERHTGWRTPKCRRTQTAVDLESPGRSFGPSCRPVSVPFPPGRWRPPAWPPRKRADAGPPRTGSRAPRCRW